MSRNTLATLASVIVQSKRNHTGRRAPNAAVDSDHCPTRWLLIKTLAKQLDGPGSRLPEILSSEALNL